MNFAEMINDKVNEMVRGAVESLLNDYAIEDAIESVFDNYDFEGAIETTIEDNLHAVIESRIDDSISEMLYYMSDLSDMIVDVIDERLN